MRWQRAIRAVLAAAVLLAGCGGGGGGSSSTPPVAALAAPATATPAAPAPAPAPAPQPPPASPAPGADSTAVAGLQAALAGLEPPALYEVAHTQLSLRTPENVLADGLAQDYGLATPRLDNLALSYRNDTLAMYQLVQQRLAAIDASTLDGDARIAHEVYSWHIEREVANRAFPYHGRQLDDTLATYFLLLDFPIITLADADLVLHLLGQLPAKLEQFQAILRAGSSLGIVEPRYSLVPGIDNLEYIAREAVEQQPLYIAFRESLDALPALAAGQRDDLLQRMAAELRNRVMPAYQQVATLARSELLALAPAAIGAGAQPDGAAFYQQRLRHHTTTALDADAIHRLGLEQLALVHAELAERFDALGYPEGETLQQRFARVAGDGGTVSAAASKATYQQFVDRGIALSADLFHRLPSTPLAIIPGGGGYLPAPANGVNPAFYLAPIGQDQPYFLIPTLTYHEAVPGHHLQIANARENTALAPFRRRLRFTGFTEGWGLYAERLAAEQGWYADDPWGDLGRLQFEAMRAARLVVDTGIHALGWSAAEAEARYVEATGFSDDEAARHIRRYTTRPGQATAYMVGMLHILDLRQRVQNADSAAFNLPDFHALVLDGGAMPLDTLSLVVEQALGQ